jgi:hypothetical protein
MKGLVLFLFFISIILFYQNCSENPDDFQSKGLNVSCTPEDQCLKYSLEIHASEDDKTAGVCINTKSTENGTTSEPKFSQGCAFFSAECSYCNLNNSHQVTFNVTASDSKIGAPQSITINFTPDGKAQVIDY